MRVDLKSDGELVAAVGGRDAEALRVLYERHAPWLSLRLSRRCADRDVVDSALQDTFVAVWRHPSRYRGQGEVAAWIWGIASLASARACPRARPASARPCSPPPASDSGRGWQRVPQAPA